MPTFPSGVSMEDLRARLDSYERQSHLGETARNLFGEGPHLVSSSDLPWGDDVRESAKGAYLQFLHAVTWMTGSGLFEMEREVVSWLGDLLGAASPAGLITSGGTESNLCALLTAKARAGRSTGSVIFPSYAHYSFPKGCEMFGLNAVRVPPPTGSYTGADAEAYEEAIDDSTVAIVATAGTFPFGTIDDIGAIAEVARRHRVYLHVDACCGGYLLPFLERHPESPREVPVWDFRVPGVCSISADLHKHGMVPPPASTLIFREQSMLDHAKRICPPHGAIAGTRPGGPIAAAWTMQTLLGVEGYCQIAAKCIALRDALIAGIADIPDVEVYPGCHINIFTVYSETRDLYPAWVQLRREGWMLSTKDVPPPSSLVLWALPHNEPVIDTFLDHLQAAIHKTPAIGRSAVVQRLAGFDAYGDIWDDVDNAPAVRDGA